MGNFFGDVGNTLKEGLGYTPFTGFGALGGGSGPLSGLSSGGGIFGPGGLLGGPVGPTPLEQGQAAFIGQNLQNNQALWPYIQQMLKDSPENAQKVLQSLTGAITPAYGQTQGSLSDATAALKNVYPGAQAGMNTGTGIDVATLSAMFPQALGQLQKANQMQQNFQLPPQAQALLDKQRAESTSGLQTQLQTMLGNSMGDLAKRGMTSSSTAEGAVGGLTTSLAPLLAQINSQYTGQQLALPGQLSNALSNNALQQFGLGQSYGSGINSAMTGNALNQFNMGNTYSGNLANLGLQGYNLANNYGGTLANAQQNAYMNPFQMYMQPFNTTAGIATTPGAKPQPNNSGLSSAIGAGLGSFLAA